VVGVAGVVERLVDEISNVGHPGKVAVDRRVQVSVDRDGITAGDEFVSGGDRGDLLLSCPPAIDDRRRPVHPQLWALGEGSGNRSSSK
jgi:hypothetical protein